MSLTAEAVNKLFLECLFKPEEVGADGQPLHPKDVVIVKGITMTAGLHKNRVAEHKAEIFALCDELPDDFKHDKGGGTSFLNMCNDRNGVQWTGLHRTMQELVLLGEAAGKIKCLTSQEMWSALPGGMPYYVVVPA